MMGNRAKTFPGFTGEELTAREWAAKLDTRINQIYRWAGKYGYVPAPRQKKIVEEPLKKDDSICWGCIHAVPDARLGTGCSWSERGVLVDGSAFIEKGVCHYGQILRRIMRCPEFVRREE